MEIAWTPELRHLLATGVHVPLDGDVAAAVADVSRQLAAAGIDPERPSSQEVREMGDL